MKKYIIYKENLTNRQVIHTTNDKKIHYEYLSKLETEAKYGDAFSTEIVDVIKYKSTLGWKFIDKSKALEIARDRYSRITTHNKTAEYINTLFEGISFREEDLK